MMKVISALCAIAASNAVFAGINMMSDPDVNRKPLAPEFKKYGTPSEGSLTAFEEEYTWNRCARFDFLTNSTVKGEISANCGIQIGGDAKKSGFPVEGGKKYRFAFEIKGTTPWVIVAQRSWDANGKCIEQKATKLQTIGMSPKDWTAIKGEIETPKEAVRTALLLQIWGHGKRYLEECTPPHYFMVDKILFEEVTQGRQIWPVRAIAVPEDGSSATASDFYNLSLGKEPAHYPSTMNVRCDDRALVFDFAFSNGKPVVKVKQDETGSMAIFTEDHLELFLGTVGKNAGLRQFVVGAGGARWMAGANPDFGSWRASVKETEAGWSCRVAVPWKTLGYAAKPEKGAEIRFNAMYEKVVGEGQQFDASKATRIGRGIIFDDSVFSFTGEEVANAERLGVILIGTDEKYGDDPSAWWYRTKRAEEDARLAKLAREKFVVAQVEPHTNPEIPYLPEQLYDPQATFTLRAAINERVVLPVAIANMTDELEEYRVTLQAGFEHPNEAYEHPMPQHGFVRADGKKIGLDHITMRRGVRFRDSNAPQHGKRYDVLAKMNEVSSVPVAPKEAGLVWIQVDCRGLEPGLYTSELLVTPLSGGHRLKGPKHTRGKDGKKSIQIFDDSKAIPVTFEVLPFALPEPTTMALNAFKTAWNAYQVDFMKQYDYTYYCVTPWFFDVKINPDGSLAEKKPRSFLLPHLEILNKEVKRIGNNPRAYVCYSCFPTFRDVHIKLFNKHIEYNSPAFWRAYREWMQYIDETMRKAGFSNDDYAAEIFDEPNPKTIDAVTIRKVYEETRAAVPKMRLRNTNGERNYFKGINELVDEWDFSQHVFGLKECEPMPKAMINKGGRVSLYACGTEMRQDLYRYYRLLPWKAAKFGGDHVGLYQLFDGVPAACFREATDGGVAYDTAEEMVPSIRLENLYIGMTDVRYLRLLEATAKEKPNHKESAAALKFVQTALAETVSRYGADTTRAGWFRDECVRYLRLLAK